MIRELFASFAVIAIFVLCVRAFATMQPLLYDYRLREDSLEITVLRRWVAHRISFADMAYVGRVSAMEAFLEALRPWRGGRISLGNRLFGTTVEVVMRGGAVYYFTPADADEFISIVASQIRELSVHRPGGS